MHPCVNNILSCHMCQKLLISSTAKTHATFLGSRVVCCMKRVLSDCSLRRADRGYIGHRKNKKSVEAAKYKRLPLQQPYRVFCRAVRNSTRALFCASFV